MTSFPAYAYHRHVGRVNGCLTWKRWPANIGVMTCVPAFLDPAVSASVVEEDPVWAALMSATPATEQLSEEEEAIVDAALERVQRGKRGIGGAQVRGIIDQMRREQDG